MNFLTKLFDRVWTGVKVTTLIFIALFGVSILIGTFAWSITIVSKLFSLIVCAIGSTIGASICSLSIARITGLIANSTMDNISTIEHENAELHKKLSEEFSQKLKITQRCAELDSEVERLKRMTIDITQISPTLKLITLQNSGAMTDVVKSEIGRDSTIFGKPIVYEYVGAYHIKFKGNIGVDLQQIRIRKSNNEIFISKIKAQPFGFEHYDDRPIFGEIRKFKDGIISNSAEILTEDSRIQDQLLKQRIEIKERLELSVCQSGLNEASEKIASEFLRRILSSTECNIIFTENDTEEALPLLEFLALHNNELTQRISSLETEKKGLTQPFPA